MNETEKKEFRVCPKMGPMRTKLVEDYVGGNSKSWRRRERRYCKALKKENVEEGGTGARYRREGTILSAQRVERVEGKGGKKRANATLNKKKKKAQKHVGGKWQVIEGERINYWNCP